MQIVSRLADPHQSGTQLLGSQEELPTLERQGMVIRAVVRIGLDPCRVQLHQAEHVIGVDDKVFKTLQMIHGLAHWGQPP